MKRFMVLHYGFEPPTPEIMAAWGQWFEAIADVNVEQGGFAAGREISKAGTEELSWGPDSITGFNIIEAESLDAAEAIARENPFIKSIRVYEIRSN
jgi:uncharacterized protein YciI